MGLLNSVKRRACDVFVDVAAPLTRETVLFRGNVNKTCVGSTVFVVLFTVSLSFVVYRCILLD